MFSTSTNQTLGANGARGIKRVLAGLVLSLAGSVAVTAWAAHPGHDGPAGHGGPGGGFGAPGLFFGPSARTDRAVDRMLEGLNASDAQRTQIKQIAQAASGDLKALREANRGQHERALAVFTAPVVDARAVETLRQQQLAQHDQASKRVSQALVDISNALTPDQRVKLAERIKQRAERMHERMERRHAASAPGK